MSRPALRRHGVLLSFCAGTLTFRHVSVKVERDGGVHGARSSVTCRRFEPRPVPAVNWERAGLWF